MGTSHSEHLNKLCKEIWVWCIADLESRQNQSQTEWMLNITLLSRSLQTLRFKPDIDLFASRLNSQFPKYVAYRLDPESVVTDAFTIHWADI